MLPDLDTDFSRGKSGGYLSQNFPQFVVIHTVKGFGIVNKAEIDDFMELSCFFDDLVIRIAELSEMRGEKRECNMLRKEISP